MKTIFTLGLFLVSLQAVTQSYTVSGYVFEKGTGEALIGANIYITTLQKGTTTNNYGFYSITLPQRDSLGIAFSYLGFVPQFKKIYLQQNIDLDVEMESAAGTLEEVVVTSRQSEEHFTRPQMGVVHIPTEKIRELPAILGESDVLKVVQLLPGVQAGNEGTAGFHVRGGTNDQNLVQLDEAVVYNPNHLFGLFSTFNTRALNNVTLIKGGFPAQFGGRLSSVLDIQMKEGNNQKFAVEGGIGLITSQLTLEGPIKKDTASFIISGRRTYFDWLVRPFLPKGNQSNYYFYDLNAKVNWQVSPKDRIFLSAFNGRDDASYQARQGVNYDILFGNATGTLRWNHLFGQKLFLNTSLIYNQYDQEITTRQDNTYSQVFSGIDDWNGKLEFQYFPNPEHNLRFGLHYTNHRFRSSGKSEAQSAATPNEGINRGKVPEKYFNEFALYINDEFVVNDFLSASLGLRLPGFASSSVKYYRVEPRATIKMAVNSASSLKASYTLMNQFIHLVPSSTATVPTDVWVPFSELTKPQRAEQFALGYFRNFRQGHLEASLEVYYKNMDNQVLFREGNQLIESLNIDQSLEYGRGWSYGSELLVRKSAGRLSGWLAYTLSWTEQQFENLNFGRKFPFRYDRRHDLALTGTYQLGRRWRLSGTFIFSSGAAYTLPVGRISTAYGGSLFEGNYFIYENRNNARLRNYHRIDLSATYRKEGHMFRKPVTVELVFGLYNVYSRQNPYFVYFQVDPLTDRPKATQVSLLPIIPSLTYNFKF